MLSMKNFKITSKEDGKEYWISRACAVVGITYAIDPETGELFFLVSKRGPGCPDFIGSWAFTCGYLDWGETKKEAVKRELWEELGLEVTENQITRFCEIDDPKRDARENVVTRYLVKLDFLDTMEKLRDGKINGKSSVRGGEDDEVSEVKLISEKDVDNLTWAFGRGEKYEGHHGDVLKDAVEFIRTGKKPNGAE